MNKARFYLVILTFVLVVSFTACNSTTPVEEEIVTTDQIIQTPEETAPPVITADNESSGTVLPTELKRGCTDFATGGFDNAGLAIGEMAVDFTLKDMDGKEYTLSQLLGEKPVVIVFGSFT